MYKYLQNVENGKFRPFKCKQNLIVSKPFCILQEIYFQNIVNQMLQDIPPPLPQ